MNGKRTSQHPNINIMEQMRTVLGNRVTYRFPLNASLQNIRTGLPLNSRKVRN